MSEFLSILDGIGFPDDPIDDPSIQTIERDSIERVPVRINQHQENGFLTEIAFRLSDRKHKRSQFIKSTPSANPREDRLESFEKTTIERDDNLDYCELWIKNDLQVRITPYGNKKDNILACLWFRFLPNTEWQKLGILKLSGNEKKIFFSSIEANYILPENRVRIFLLLKNYGLIPNEFVKDANCTKRQYEEGEDQRRKERTILSSEKLLKRLNLIIIPGSNPTIPYTLQKDDREKKPSEVKQLPDRVDRRRYSKKVADLQNEVVKARCEAIKASRALERANRDHSYQADRVEVISVKTRDRVMPQTKGKRYDLSR